MLNNSNNAHNGNENLKKFDQFYQDVKEALVKKFQNDDSIKEAIKRLERVNIEQNYLKISSYI